MSNLIIKVSRYNSGTAFVQEYRLPYQPAKTAFWWLTKIREDLDSSLAFECSCRAGLCGACGIRLNGRSVLACAATINLSENSADLTCTIEPLNGFPIIRDLIIDWRPVMKRLKTKSPWLSQHQTDLRTSAGQSMEESAQIHSLAACMLCGICVSECPVISQGNFAEPFMFVKAYRLISDSRLNFEKRRQILQNVQPFLSYCLQCGRCRNACPKGISPAAAIIGLQKTLETQNL